MGTMQDPASELLRTTIRRISQNAVKAKFVEALFF